MDNSLAQRTANIIKDAGISPRILGAATKLHWTSIYAIMNGREPNPLTKDALHKACDKIEQLIVDGKLPFSSDVPHAKRTEKLVELLAT